jgi:hypothetical protein
MVKPNEQALPPATIQSITDCLVEAGLSAFASNGRYVECPFAVFIKRETEELPTAFFDVRATPEDIVYIAKILRDVGAWSASEHVVFIDQTPTGSKILSLEDVRAKYGNEFILLNLEGGFYVGQ